MGFGRLQGQPVRQGEVHPAPGCDRTAMAGGDPAFAPFGVFVAVAGKARVDVANLLADQARAGPHGAAADAGPAFRATGRALAAVKFRAPLRPLGQGQVDVAVVVDGPFPQFQPARLRHQQVVLQQQHPLHRLDAAEIKQRPVLVHRDAPVLRPDVGAHQGCHRLLAAVVAAVVEHHHRHAWIGVLPQAGHELQQLFASVVGGDGDADAGLAAHGGSSQRTPASIQRSWASRTPRAARSSWGSSSNSELAGSRPRQGCRPA